MSKSKLDIRLQKFYVLGDLRSVLKSDVPCFGFILPLMFHKNGLELEKCLEMSLLKGTFCSNPFL